MGILDGIINVLDSFVVRPIGLYNKSYQFMVEHLDRNIGTGNFTYDGYSTPIGTLSNPYYNAIMETPWFINDDDKSSYSNYLDYIRGVYGASTSILNINNEIDYILHSDDTAVGVIGGRGLEEAINSNGRSIITNPNFSDRDTMLGKTTSILVDTAMSNAIRANDDRAAKKFSISEPMKEYFGMNTKAFENKILEISDKKSQETGRFEDLSPLKNIVGPLDESNYGTFKSLGTYNDFYRNGSEKTRSFFDENISRNKFKFIEGSDYITSLKITPGAETLNSTQVRHIFQTLAAHKNIDINGALWSYAETENGVNGDINGGFNGGIAYGYVTSYGGSTLSANDLLKKTNDNFRNDKYKTLVARFHTKSTDIDMGDSTQTAISKKYGMSKGRNLLKVTPDKSEGYDNPYCRVWTYHHQYHRLSDAIRPLIDNDKVVSQGDLENVYNFSSFRTPDSGLGSGGSRLSKYGSMHSSPNGLVNITPIDDGENKISIKNCMFSIENLAWKGMYGEGRLSDEQRGPFGGRIMWFPPYGLQLNESVNVSWNSTQFIGRGEDIYTYTNTSRRGGLSFKLLIDHPSILDFWANRNNNEMSSTVDDINSSEQQLLRFFAGCDMLTAKDIPLRQDNQVAFDDTVPKPETMSITFMVFYPNDYSGESDTSTKPGSARPSAYVPMAYLANGVGAMKRANGTDYSILPLVKVYSDSGHTKQVGGYEVRDGVGVSIVSSSDTKSSSITDVWWLDDTSKTYKRLSLGKIVGDKNRNAKWAYRVDEKRKNEKLDESADYVDRQSFKLNSGGHRKEICETYGISEDTLYSFTDVYVAMVGTDAANVLAGYYDPTRVKALNDMLSKYKIGSIEGVGYASSHGHTPNENVNLERNNTLIKNRAKTVLNWLKNCKKVSSCGSWPEPNVGRVGGPGGKRGDASALNAKLYRAAKITINLQVENTKTAQQTLTEDNVITGDGFLARATNLIKGTKETPPNSSNVNIQADGTTAKDTYKEQSDKNSKVDNTQTTGNRTIKNTDGSTTMVQNNDKAGQPEMKAESGTTTVIEDVGDYHRYDEEAEFFKLLKVNDPFMHHKITDKIKYFDPAFHSISPEGFNARLTFLHQCTRQGPTVGASDEIVKSANNLAFGRQPVCVLRIGDFYYTKIIIESISITYDPLVWDLNTEGIGVMPMIANVQMNFIFIGGSDIAGPIARLQNAVSFNYYANTGVYDDRAEQIEYNDDHTGKINKIKLFP